MSEEKTVQGTEKEFKPYVPADTTMKEFTFRALAVGAILSIILGAANAYIGLKVGLTVAATFPAAVMAMAILRLFKGSILEENTCRTTAAVGEALAAGAIFTIPALLIAKNPATGKPIWENIHYMESTVLMVTGGILGVLFVTFLRRILIEDKTLRFPESLACAEMVKAGQGESTGAKYVFGAMALSGLFELFKNSRGLWAVREKVQAFFPINVSNFKLNIGGEELVSNPTGGVFVESPGASGMLMGVGFIIGPKLASITFAGGVFGHMVLVPLFMFIFGGFESYLSVDTTWVSMAGGVFASQVKPFAVGTMLVGAVFTLFNMRKSLGTGMARAINDLKQIGKTKTAKTNRLDQDIPYSVTAIGIALLVIPITIIYYVLCHNLIGAIVAALVMTVTGFLFAAVAGFLVGTIGSSNNPISGITLSTLIVAAFLMTAIGVTGAPGIAAVLGVAAVVCCSSGVAGDIMQDLKVGHILGGTPKYMEYAVMIGVVAAALVMGIALQLLHSAYGGIGSVDLPAPQASLMAALAEGIVGGEMAWPLVIMGIFFGVGLIIIGAPSIMLIAVGMYLPLYVTAGIFVGGVIKSVVDKIVAKRKLNAEKVENTGILISSGLIAGEAIVALIIAATVLAGQGTPLLPKLIEGGNPWLGLVVFGLAIFTLIYFPLKSAEKDA
ncbi:oligopeptide transporter, OPT family [candidate division KSB1 bacterium]|nr:oligopeptide transporter, OPT family [candidate division KSB1 bacterium]